MKHRSKENVIAHLQIIHTWAEFARERDLQFFTPKHLEDIAQWSDDAITLLKEQEEAHKILVETADEMYAMLKEQKAVKPVLVGHMWECGNCHAPVSIYLDDRRDDFCRKCGRKVQWDA